jgi:hypothetical protein
MNYSHIFEDKRIGVFPEVLMKNKAISMQNVLYIKIRIIVFILF